MFKQLKSFIFDELFILKLIIINSIVIFIQQFGVEIYLLDYLDFSFTLIFIFEAIIKIREFKWKKYIEDNWNRLDLLLVMISLPSLLTIFVNIGSFDLSVFFALRSLRVFKAFRLIRFLPDIEQLMSSIKRALKTSYIIGIGFFILIFIVSLVSCALYKDVAPEYFGNPLQSIYAIFQLFSVEGWYEIPDLIAERSTPLWGSIVKLYFSVLLLIGGIIGLSLVNSIFVDAMVEDNNDELEKEVQLLHDKIDKLLEEIDKK